MERDIITKNVEEFENLIKNGNITISDILVDTILKNLKTKKKHLYAFSVHFTETEGSYDITLNRDHFADILEKNLQIQEKFECYEKCSEILKALKKLKKMSLLV
jgi:hypothetical protein